MSQYRSVYSSINKILLENVCKPFEYLIILSDEMGW